MKRKSFLIAFVVAVILFSGCSIADTPAISAEQAEYQPEEDYDLEIERLGQMVDTILTGNNFRGVALVAQNGTTVLRAAYGMACDAQNIENTVYLPFHLASVTKHFTGAAILLLGLDGKLDTSDTLDNFFIGHDGLGNVTVAHLLAMKGGFYNYENRLLGLIEAGEFEKGLSLSAEDIEAHIISNWSGVPQDYSVYCNSDYWLLGRIIEQVSGMTYEEFVANRLFAPAGMVNSGFGGMHESVAPHGIQSVYFGGQNVMDLTNLPFHFLYSTGGLVSTVDDLNIWLDAYFDGELFPKHLLDDISAGRYNYGWIFADDEIWHHPGSMPGFNTWVIHDRSSGTRIILLSNETRGVAELVRAVSVAVLGTPIAGMGIPIGS